MKNPKELIAQFLVRIGISANFLTALGLFFAFLSGALICLGSFFWAGVILLLSGLCDLLDGAVARASGKAGVFGGILDSSLDRYGDGFVLAPLIACAAYYHKPLLSALASSALLGSFAVSYVRARVECEIDSCRVGFWERGERLVYLALGLLLGNIFAVLLVLGVGIHWTVFQRLAYSYRVAQNGGQIPADSKPYPSRRSKVYALKITALILIVLFLRLPW